MIDSYCIRFFTSAFVTFCECSDLGFVHHTFTHNPCYFDLSLGFYGAGPVNNPLPQITGILSIENAWHKVRCD